MEILILFDCYHKAFFLEICLLQQPGNESEDSVVAEVWLVLQFICAVLDLREVHQVIFIRSFFVIKLMSNNFGAALFHKTFSY